MSDDEDFVSFTPLQRNWSQISHPQSYKKEKLPRLSLSQRSSKNGVPLSQHRKIRRVKNKPKVISPSKFFSCSTPIKEKKKTVQSFVKEDSFWTHEQKLNCEVCSICMMPWIAYECNGKSREFHIDECLDVDFSVKAECEAGVKCNEVHENHFWKFSHKVLAEIRAGHELAVSRRLSQSAKDQEDKRDIKKMGNTYFLSSEDLAVAGPSGVERSALTSKRGEISSCIFKSENNSDEGYISTKTNKSIELFDFDQGNCSSEGATVSFGYKKPLLGKHNPVMDRHKNLGRTKHTSRELSFDIFENKEIPDLDISSLSHINDDRLVADEPAIEFKKPMSLQVTRHDICRDDVFDESTVIFNKSSADQNCMVDFSETEICASDADECDENARHGFGKISSKSSPSVSLLQNITESTGDSGTHIEQQLNKIQNKDDDLRTIKIEITENDNGDGNTCFDKPILSREECQENDGSLENLVELAVKKYFDIADKMNVQRNDIKKPPVSTSQKDQDTRTNEKVCQGGPSCKPCIHIHFHLEKIPETSRRGGQTSILDFFQSTKADKIPDSTATNKCAACCACGGGESKLRNEMSRAESWKELMSLMQKKKFNTPSVTKSSISSRGNKDQQQDQDEKKKWQQRKCPFYKYIPDTDIVVDAFCYGYLEGVRAYFLTHFHYDHYRGLKKSFNHPIYCSEITAKLVNLRIGVPNQYLHPLPLEDSRVVCDVEVTLLDANHCPGSVMFLFRLRTGSTILHVGDFRAHPKMESYPALWNSSIDVLYLDTTYCNPLYDFPSQEDILEKCVSVATHHVHDNPRTLIVVGSYSIGKERVFKAIASSLNCLVWASTDKQKTLRCIQDEEIQARLTSDKYSARVHVVPMMDLKPQKLMKYVENLKPCYTVVVAIRPTGWEHSGDSDDVLHELSPKQYGNIYIYGIPYSEHSSYAELKRFVQFIQPKKVIPTVNVGNPSTRKRMEQDIMEWLKKSNGSGVTKLFGK